MEGKELEVRKRHEKGRRIAYSFKHWGVFELLFHSETVFGMGQFQPYKLFLFILGGKTLVGGVCESGVRGESLEDRCRLVKCHEFFVTRIRIRFTERQTVLVSTMSAGRGRLVRVAVGGHDNIVMMDEGGESAGNKTDRGFATSL